MIIKNKILKIIFWLAFVVGIVMVAWRILGNNPTDLEVITPFIVMALSGIWFMNNDLQGFKQSITSSFLKVKNDFNNMENKINRIESKIDELLNKKTRGKK